MKPPKCKPSGNKTRYPNQRIASRELRKIRAAAAERNDPTEKVPDRSYECGYCQGYHLTSQTVQDEPLRAVPRSKPRKRKRKRW